MVVCCWLLVVSWDNGKATATATATARAEATARAKAKYGGSSLRSE
jgi:hypothetical protein